MLNYRKIAGNLTSYKRDLLWSVHRANKSHDTPVGADIKNEMEELGRNTAGGQFYPRLNELAEDDFIKKNDHPEDPRGFTAELSKKGKATLTELALRTVESLEIEIPNCALPNTGMRTGSRGGV